MAAMLLVAVGLNWGVGSGYVAQNNKDYAQMSANIQQVQIQSQKITEAENRAQKVKDAFDKLSKTPGMPEFPFIILQAAVLETRPPDVCLDEVQIRLDGYLIIRGVSPSRTSINTFLGNITKVSTYFIVDGKAEYNVAPMNPRQDPRFSQPVYDFTIAARTRLKRARIRTFGDQPGYKPPVENRGLPGQPFPGR
jgi:hypothetical protein